MDPPSHRRNNTQEQIALDCATCKKSFQSKKALEQHLSSPKHTLNCVNCNIVFQNRQTLNLHLEDYPQHRTSTKALPTNASLPLPKPRQPSLGFGVGDHSSVIEYTPDTITTKELISTDLKISEQWDGRWSIVSASEHQAVLESLIARCHSPTSLKSNGYRLYPFTTEEIDSLQRCENCGGT